MQIIRHLVLSSDTSSFELTAIPQTFTDLLVILSARSDRSNNNSSLYLGMNGVATNQSSITLQGNGSVVDSYSPAYIDLGQITANSSPAGAFSSQRIYIARYTESTPKYVTAESVNGDTVAEAYPTLIHGKWDSTSAITSLEFVNINATNFRQYSSATLIGITAGSDGTTTVS